MTTFELVRDAVAVVAAVCLVVWLFVRGLKRSDDPGRAVIKFICSLILIGGELLFARLLWSKTAGSLATDFLPVALLVGSAAATGIVLTAIWGASIGSWLARPLTGLFDGGNVEVESRPLYSMAEARRKRGRYAEAMAEIEAQLEKFPGDFTGQLMLAEIQAENLNDLQGAEQTIQRLRHQKNQTPANIALALYSLADWHLKLARDREAARADLQQVVDGFPDSPLALIAAQRIAHLPSEERLRAWHAPPPVVVPEGVRNLGLLESSAHLRPAEPEPAKLTLEYVKHLEEHPLDSEAREKLAILYADHYQRLDLAAGQLQQLIEQPSQPARLVAHCLNLLADLQIRHGAGYEAVRQTLEQIIQRYPDSAHAQVARNRLDLVKLELKAKGTGPGVKLGEYEQNIGLKAGLSRGQL